MPVVIFFTCLDLEQKSSFMDGHELIILIRLHNLTSRRFYNLSRIKVFNANLFMQSEWKNGMLEYWNIGGKGGNKPF